MVLCIIPFLKNSCQYDVYLLLLVAFGLMHCSLYFITRENCGQNLPREFDGLLSAISSHQHLCNESVAQIQMYDLASWVLWQAHSSHYFLSYTNPTTKPRYYKVNMWCLMFFYFLMLPSPWWSEGSRSYWGVRSSVLKSVKLVSSVVIRCPSFVNWSTTELWFVCIVWYRSCKALWRLPVGISVVPDCPIAAAGPPNFLGASCFVTDENAVTCSASIQNRCVWRAFLWAELSAWVARALGW